MPRILNLCSVFAFALGLSASAVFADLTAEEVWSEWQSYLSDLGYDVSGTQSVSGGTLNVTDVRIGMDFSQDGEAMAATVTMDTLTFEETGDGGVRMTLPPVSKINITGQPSEGPAFDLTLDYTQSGFVMLMTGDPSDMTSAYSADSFGIALSDLNRDGVPMGRDMVSVAVNMADLAGTSRMVRGNLRSYTQSITSGTLSYDITGNNPAESSAIAISGAVERLAFDGRGDLPTIEDATDMNAMLAAGFNFDGAFTYGDSETTYDFQSLEGNGNMTTNSDGGRLGVKLSDAGLAYDLTQSGLALNMLVSQMPIPISLNMEAVSVSMLMPVQASENQQDFGLKVALEDFTMSDILWGMFDPQGQLPRDPATMAFDLAGKARLLFDTLDPQVPTAMNAPNGVPGEVDAIEIKDITIDVAGASLDGKGAFSFDNSDTQTFGGMPKPTGRVDLTLVGGNGLIDKLVAMGLLPQEQAMGARMMMGLFAVPGDAPDTLNSTLEINEQGHILANGQRIQ